MTRPYLSLGIQELEKLFAHNQDDTNVLQNLQAELSRRTTDRAACLCRRVEERLSSIGCSASQGDFFEGRAARVKPATTARQPLTDPPPVRTVTPRSVEQKEASGTGGVKGRNADAAAPDDRRRPSRFSRISAAGIRGKPDPFQPALDTDVVLKVPAGASRAVRYTVALDALIAEMRRKGSGQKRYELENGRVIEHQAGQCV